MNEKFALSGYEIRREWLQRKSTMGHAENITGNIRKKGDKCLFFILEFSNLGNAGN